MKKIFLMVLLIALLFCLAACSCSLNDGAYRYNTVERSSWDIYATLDCFVKTEYNKDGNPLSRRLYSTQTFENGLLLFYQYDGEGLLCKLSVEGKDSQNDYFKNERFELSFDEDGLTQNGRPLYGSRVYESISLTWDENHKLQSEYVKSATISVFTYDENGGIAKEHYSETAKELTHRYNEDGNSILITEVDSLTEKMTLTLGENGMPATLTSDAYTIDYTYTDEGFCTQIDIEVLGQKLSDVLISYDEKGNPIKREVNAHANGKVVPAALYEYEYDEAGNMVRETVSQADATLDLKVVLDSEYRYDENGRILEETHGTYSSPGNLTAKRNTVHEYDENGNRTQQTSIHTNPSGKIVRSKGSERYYPNGRLLATASYAFHSNWTLKEVVEEEYNQERVIVKHTTSSYWQGEKIDGVLTDGKLRDVWLQEYDDEGALTKVQHNRYTKDGLLASKDTTTFVDKAKKSFVSISYYQDNSVEKKTTEEYYADGVTLKSKETIGYTQEGVVSDKTTLENDEKGNPLKYSQLQLGGTEKESETIYEYTYYDNGIAKTMRISNFYTGILSQSVAIEYDADGNYHKDIRMEYHNGKLSSKEERFFANNSLQKIVTYRYDENGNEISREEKPA